MDVLHVSSVKLLIPNVPGDAQCGSWVSPTVAASPMGPFSKRLAGSEGLSPKSGREGSEGLSPKSGQEGSERALSPKSDQEGSRRLPGSEGVSRKTGGVSPKNVREGGSLRIG